MPDFVFWFVVALSVFTGFCVGAMFIGAFAMSGRQSAFENGYKWGFEVGRHQGHGHD